MQKNKNILTNNKEAIAIIFAMVLLLPVMIGFVGLGVEVGLWYKAERDLNYVVSMASIAGTRELSANISASSDIISNVVNQSATLNDCTKNNCCFIDNIHHIRTNGSLTDNGIVVSAHVIKPYLFIGYFLKSTTDPTICGDFKISATGKSIFEFKTEVSYETSVGYKDGCILGLDKTAMYTVWLKNNSSLKCPVISNSKCQGANSAMCSLDN